MKYLVVGCGHSGMSVIHLLKKKGKKTIAYDDFLPSTQIRKQLHLLNTPLLNKKEVTTLDFSSYTIVISPGVPKTHWLITKAKNQTSIISELDLALTFYKGRILAITGTNGKSTTAKMCHHILNKLSINNMLAGNFGTSLSAILAKDQFPDILVLELSSYQIEQTKTIDPDVSIFTTFSADHLERHKTMSNYFNIKWRIFKSTKQGFRGFCTPDIISVYKRYKSKFASIDNIELINDKNTPSITYQSTKIKEQHNLENARLAAAACSFLTKTSISSISDHLKSFKPISHRYETLGTIDNRVIINDSKATNLESTLAAIKATPGPILLLLGGVTKTDNFRPLLKLSNKISHLMTFGKSAAIINKSLSQDLHLTTFSSLKLVMTQFYDILKRTDCVSVLFSPAGASHDEFVSFEERGYFFSQNIRTITHFKNKEKNEHQDRTP